METCAIAVLGGDKRMDFAARELTKLGYDVREWGRSEMDSVTAFSKSALQRFLDVDAIMLPMPTSFDGTHLWTPLRKDGEELRMETLFHIAPDKLWQVI